MDEHFEIDVNAFVNQFIDAAITGVLNAILKDEKDKELAYKLFEVFDKRGIPRAESLVMISEIFDIFEQVAKNEKENDQ